MTKSALGMILALIAMLGLSTTATAEIPRLMSFQGRLCNSADSPVNGNYDFTFTIYDVASGGAALWTEVQNGIPVENGVYNILLGSATALNLSFDTSYWLGVAVAPDAEMTPRYRLTSAPYAFSSDTATTATNGTGLQRYVVSGTFDTSAAGDSQATIDTGGAVWGIAHYVTIVDPNIDLTNMPIIQVSYEKPIVGQSDSSAIALSSGGYKIVTGDSWKIGGLSSSGLGQDFFGLSFVAFESGKIHLLYRIQRVLGGAEELYGAENGSKYYLVIIK